MCLTHIKNPDIYLLAMHAFLITGSDTDSVDKKVAILADKLAKKTINFQLEKIENVRDLNKLIKLTLDETTAIIVRDIHKSTVPALNAFLKTLEEPQEKVIFIITAQSEYKVLPTILSRCQVIRVTSINKNRKNQRDIITFNKKTVGQKLAIIDKIKKRDEAVDFLEKLIYFNHQKLISDNKNLDATSRLLELTQDTLNNINRNGNVGLQLTNLVVSSNRINA